MKRFLPLIVLFAAPTFAQEQVYRLSEADKKAAIEEASRQPEQTTRLPIVSGRAPGTADKRVPGRVQGEVGMMVGTGGTRAIYGSTLVPLGESGSAQFSFGTGRFPGVGYGGVGDIYGNRAGYGRDEYGFGGGNAFGRYGDPRLSPYGLAPF